MAGVFPAPNSSTEVGGNAIKGVWQIMATTKSSKSNGAITAIVDVKSIGTKGFGFGTTPDGKSVFIHLANGAVVERKGNKADLGPLATSELGHQLHSFAIGEQLVAELTPTPDKSAEFAATAWAYQGAFDRMNNTIPERNFFYRVVTFKPGDESTETVAYQGQTVEALHKAFPITFGKPVQGKRPRIDSLRNQVAKDGLRYRIEMCGSENGAYEPCKSDPRQTYPLYVF